LLGGAALAAVTFAVLHGCQLWDGTRGVMAAGGLALVLVGWGIPFAFASPTRPFRRAVQLALAATAAALWLLWPRLGAGAAPWQSAALTVCGIALLSMVFGPAIVGSRAQRIAFICGCGAGFCALSAGLAALLGVATIMQCFVLAALAVAALAPLIGHREEVAGDRPNAAGPPAALQLGAALLAAAAAVLAVLLLRTYALGAGWQAHAASDLGVGLCVGLLFRSLALGSGDGAGARGVFARALALLGVAALLESSFLLYPDLIFSEAAALQSSRTLLTAGRTFPLWLMAAALGALLPSPLVVGGKPWRPNPCVLFALAAVLLLGASSGAGTPASIRWDYGTVGALCVLALIPIYLSSQLRADLGRVALPVAGAALALGGLAWTAFGPVDLGWRHLAASFRSYQWPVAGRLNYEPAAWGQKGPKDFPLGAVTARRVPWGLDASVRTPGGEEGRFFCGNLVGSSRAQDSCSVRLAVACVLACAERAERVAVLEPALEETRVGVGLLAPGARSSATTLAALLKMDGEQGAFDAVICGPGALTAMGCPLSLVSVESLQALRGTLRDGDGGALALWLPMRTLTPADLRRVLATVLVVFPRARVFSCRDEMVLIAGGVEKLSYARLRSMFRDAGGRDYMEGGGFWDPRQVVVCLSADADDLARLAGAAAPYLRGRPSRPPVLARDLALASRAGVPALLAYCRLGIAARLADTMEFESANEKAVAMVGLGELYEAHTQQVIDGVASVARLRPHQIVEVVDAEGGEWRLFAPQAVSRRIHRGAALYQFGLYDRSLLVLTPRGGKDPGGASRDHAESLFWQGLDLEKLGNAEEAVRVYESALVLDPALPHVLMRLADIHLQHGEPAGAETRVDAVLAVEPDNVDALNLRGYLYGRRRQYDKAAEMARRALRVAPDNRTAQELLELYGAIQDLESD